MTQQQAEPCPVVVMGLMSLVPLIAISVGTPVEAGTISHERSLEVSPTANQASNSVHKGSR